MTFTMSAAKSLQAQSSIQSPSGAMVSSDSTQHIGSTSNGAGSPKSTNSSLTSPHLSTNTSNKPTASKIDVNQRSCVTCRRRKVRCNKRDPCSNCVKAGVECEFPVPGRAPRKPRRPPDAELLARLRRLEGVVESLGGQAAIDRLNSTTSSLLSPGDARPGSESLRNKSDTLNVTASECPIHPSAVSSHHFILESDPFKIQEQQNNTVHEELGRLVIDEGTSKYVSNQFWASIDDQIEEMHGLLDPISSGEEEEEVEEEAEEVESPEASTNSSESTGHLLLFGSRPVANSLLDYHPSPTQQFLLWKNFQDNVFPWVSIFHIPSLRELVFGFAGAGDTLDKNAEALVFAVYMAAVISLTPTQCLRDLGEERQALVNRYRFATEQALARANLLNSQNLMLLQAATLFLTCVRREDGSRFVWTMTAVLVRLANGLGLHRDGSKFKLTAFETEMRRRLWWHLCIMDIRASEDHGTDPIIHNGMYDTRLPSNINDEDISPDSTEIPPERVGFTDMTSALIRCEVTITCRLLSFNLPGLACPRLKTLEEREQMVEDLSARLNERYIRHCNMGEPLQWVCATVARIIVSRLWLIIHYRLSAKDQGPQLSQDMRNRLMRTSVEVLQYSHLLKTNEKTKKWGWLFRTYAQWHPVAFVLVEVCVRRPCPEVDHAWAAVNAVFDDYESETTDRKGAPWRSLSRLMKRARAIREKQQAQLRAEFRAPSTISPQNLQQAMSTYTSPALPTPEPWSASAKPNNTWPSASMASNALPRSIDTSSGKPQSPSSSLPGGRRDFDMRQGMDDFLGSMIQESRFGDPFNANLDDLQVSSEEPLGIVPSLNMNDATQPMNGSMNGGNLIPDFSAQGSWDLRQWDIVMQEFRMEVEQNGQSPMGDFGTWIG